MRHPARCRLRRYFCVGVVLFGVSIIFLFLVDPVVNDRGKERGFHALIAGNFLPDTPTILNLPTLPRRRRSNIVNPTTPTFLSEPEAPPPTKPVVYSPVPTYNYM